MILRTGVSRQNSSISSLSTESLRSRADFDQLRIYSTYIMLEVYPLKYSSKCNRQSQISLWGGPWQSEQCGRRYRILSDMGNRDYGEHSIGCHLLFNGDTKKKMPINSSTEQPLCTSKGLFHEAKIDSCSSHFQKKKRDDTNLTNGIFIMGVASALPRS